MLGPETVMSQSANLSRSRSRISGRWGAYAKGIASEAPWYPVGGGYKEGVSPLLVENIYRIEV